MNQAGDQVDWSTSRILMVLLVAVVPMVGCSSEESEEESGSGPSFSPNPGQNFVICRTDLGPVDVNDLQWSKAALAALRQLSANHYLGPLEQLSQQPALTHILLLRSAEKAGFKPQVEHARELLTQVHPDWQEEQKADVLRFDHALAEYLAITDFLVSLSSPENEDEARRDAREQMLTRVTGRRVAFDAAAWADQVPEPAQDQVHRTFEQYRDVLPGRPVRQTNPYGLGYRVPDRVDVEYLIVDLEKLAASIEPDPEDLANYYADHKERYARADADADEAMALPEVLEEVRRDLQASLARRSLQECVIRIRDRLIDRGMKDQTVSIEQITAWARQELARDCVESGSTGLSSEAQLRRRPQVGNAFVPGGGGVEARALPSRLFEQVEETEFVPHQGEELFGPAWVKGSKRLFWRIAKFEPSQSPEELSPEIVRQVVRDLRTIAAMDHPAERLAELDSETALEQFIEDYGSLQPLEARPLHDLWLLENGLPVIVGQQVFWTTERNRAYLPLRKALADYVRSHPGEGPGKLVVRIPARREVCLVQIEKIHRGQEDAPAAEVEEAYRYLRFLQHVQVLRTWMDDEMLYRRVDLQLVGE